MSMQNDSNHSGVSMSVVVVAGLFAISIVCIIGGFLILNTLIERGLFASGPGAQNAQPATQNRQPTRMAASNSPQAGHIGFNFANQTPSESAGDADARSHIFIHRYSLSSAGFITGVTYLNDWESRGSEIEEAITLLILRPTDEGWKIIYRISLPADDAPPATTGITTIRLESRLPVEKGDIFAHWQPQKSGPIPLNYENAMLDGRSAGQSGFTSANLDVGQIIRDGGFTGQRDYFINLIFEPAR